MKIIILSSESINTPAGNFRVYVFRAFLMEFNVIKKVLIEIKKGNDGYWLSFKDSKGREETIRIGHYFPGNKCIELWAKDQFE